MRIGGTGLAMLPLGRCELTGFDSFRDGNELGRTGNGLKGPQECLFEAKAVDEHELGFGNRRCILGATLEGVWIGPRRKQDAKLDPIAGNS
jgi:hypothetical protein